LLLVDNVHCVLVGIQPPVMPERVLAVAPGFQLLLLLLLELALICGLLLLLAAYLVFELA